MANTNLEHRPLHDRNQVVWQHVEGWVGDRVYGVLEWIHAHQTARNLPGDIVEIGVHHGKFFLMMTAMLRENERAVAIDLWEDQHLNVDGSGRGNRGIFLDHAALIDPEADIRLLSGDSMALRAADLQEAMASKSVRLFSVDGGHTVAHVVNDLTLAQEVIASGGIIAVDDFLGAAWPSVSEGVFKFLSERNLRLAPFLIFQNKLWLTTFSEHQDVLESAGQYFQNAVGAEWHSRWRYTQISGFKTLAFF